MIPLTKPFFNRKEIEQVQKVLESGWVAGQGPVSNKFEKKLAKYVGTKYAITLSNCTAALHLSLLALGIKSGDEVLVADYTFPATGHSVMYCGAKPVFVDINPKTYNIEPSMIEQKITSKTKAIIPVHAFGQPAEMDAINELAEKHRLKVVEDAACALGAKYKNKYAGTISDVGCFSFHGRKGITTGEGGAIVTDDEELAEKIRKLSVFGMASAWKREKTDKLIIPKFTELGYNYKMSDILAAIGIAQLGKIEKIIKRKRLLARYYTDKLSEIELIESPFKSNMVTHVYQSYVTLLNKIIDRNKLIERLLKVGIQTQIGTYASHIQPLYRSKDKCFNSLKVFNRSLSLPIYYNLNEEQIDFVINNLKNELTKLK